MAPSLKLVSLLCALTLFTARASGGSVKPGQSQRRILQQEHLNQNKSSASTTSGSSLASLNFCEHKSYSAACSGHGHLHRKDFYCNAKFKPLRELLVSYCERHKAAVTAGPEAAARGKYIVARYGLEIGGLGNRMPGIASALFIALATNRTLLLDYPNYDSYFAAPLNFDYKQLLTEDELGDASISRQNFLYANDTDFSIAARDDLEAKFGHYKNWVIWEHADYLAAPVTANPHYRQFMLKYFPTWEVFWPMSHLLFKPLAPRLQAAVDAFTGANGFGAQDHYNYVVGYQVRKVKYETLVPYTPRFHNLARAVAAGVGGDSRPIKYFVTADNNDTYAAAVKTFGSDAIFTEAASLLANSTSAANPGTEESAIIDLAILSSCNAVIISMSSSFGGCAAGLGGHHAYYLSDRQDAFDSGSPFYFKATSSEPCWYHGYWAARHLDPDALVHYEEHPMFMQWQQCHYAVGRRRDQRRRYTRHHHRFL